MRSITNIRSGESLPEGAGLDGMRSSSDAFWVDLVSPTRDEVVELEQYFGVGLPDRYDMQEIETSSRLYSEQGALFMTATLLAYADTEAVQAAPVTFVLMPRTLITIRYVDNTPFRTFGKLCEKPNHGFNTSAEALSALLDAVIDRLADILERIGGDLDTTSREIFSAKPGRIRFRDQDSRLKELLVRIGRNGDVNSKARESLLSLNRLLVYLIDHHRQAHMDQTAHFGHLKGLGRDLQSLSDHSSFLNGKIDFLQNATLGLINIEQNQIIKIFTVASMMFMPPTLIASMYGMNFDWMPVLHDGWGYWVVVLLIIGSATGPYWYFHRKGLI